MHLERATPIAFKRDPVIDCTKGIAILCVVAGHIYGGPVKDLFYAFHMPLFFFLGGHLHKNKPNRITLTTKASSLIVPYFAFMMIIVALVLVRSTNSVLSEPGSFIFRLLVGGEKLVWPFTVLWFPTCYFLSVVAWNWMQNTLAPRFVVLLCAGFWATAVFLQYNYPDFWLPWAANVCLMTIPMFFIGHNFGQEIFRPKPMVVASASAILVAYICALTFWDAPTMAMKRGMYGWPVIGIIVAMAGTILVSATAQIAVKSSLLRISLCYIGAGSLVVMYVHIPAIEIIRSYAFQHQLATFIASTVVSIGGYALLSRFHWSRRVFLGLR